MKILILIISIFSFLSLNAYASDLDEIKVRVNQLQTIDSWLPSVSEQKWIIGTILSLLFDTNGRIKNIFLDVFQGMTQNYIPRWNGTSIVNGSIYDNGTNVWIGTAIPSTKFQVVWDIQATRIKVSCVGNCF